MIPLALPPLRDRIGDLPALVMHFGALHRTRTGQAAPHFDDAAVAALMAHRWPGNVRELANIVERLAILHAGQRIGAAEVRAVLPVGGPAPAPGTAAAPTTLPDVPLSDALDAYERELIVRALAVARGNVADAARRLRTDRVAHRPAESLPPHEAPRHRGDDPRRRCARGGGRMTAPFGRRALGRRALAAALLAAPGLATALAAQDPTWSTCDPRPGRSCGGRQLTRAERVELEALHDAPSTRRETGPVLVPRDSVIPASLAVLGGPVRIAGRVEGSVLVLNGDLLLDSTAVVGGDVAVFGGRVTRVDGARTGPVRAEPDSVRYSIVDGRLTLTRRDDEVWRLLRRDDPRSSASLRLAAARTYNRVEGWPIEFGPRIRKRTAAGMLGADLYGIVRTGDRLDWTSANVGHDARLEFRPGQGETWSIAGRLYDVVTPVEDWQLSEVENGLASFIFTSDYRDHFDRHGAALELGWNGRGTRTGARGARWIRCRCCAPTNRGVRTRSPRRGRGASVR
ncbi:MAG: hypothetical protein MUF40_08135 [Gemmatimonadaceae bacterium]|nr:hypothetical protein [Gemmatimonadaceae bacterium]